MSSRTKSRRRSTRLQGQRASRTAEQNDAVCSKESASPEPPPVKRPKVSSPHGYPYEAVPGEPLDACDLSHSVNRVNCIRHYHKASRFGPEKKSTLLFPPPAESTGTQQRALEMRLSSVLFELYKQANCEAKRPFFLF